MAWQVSSSVFKGRSAALDKNGMEIESLEHYVFRSYLKKANHPYLTVPERYELLSLESTEDSSDRGECVQRTEDRAQFWEIFDWLEPRMQLIFLWREVFGYDWRLVGELVGISGHAAEVYYRRGIEKIKKKLSKEKIVKGPRSVSPRGTEEQ